MTEPPTPGSTPMMMPNNGNAGNMVFMTNPDELLHEFEQTLRGWESDKQGQYRRRSERIMNENGIAQVIPIIKSVVNRNTVMSNYTDRNVWAILDGEVDTLIQTLMMGRVTFQINGDPQAVRSSIVTQGQNLSIGAAQRAYQEGDKRFWKGNVIEFNYGTSGDQQPQKKGLLGGLSPNSWKK